MVHRLATAGDESNTTLVCFHDLSKAFDRVWHNGPLTKLHHFGVRSCALPWITDYLSDRRQCVRIRNSTSSWLPLPAGVRQGSVLGPLFFLAYSIDLPNCVRHPEEAREGETSCLFLTRSLIAVSPQASYDRRRHRNCFPTRPAHAFPKK